MALLDEQSAAPWPGNGPLEEEASIKATIEASKARLRREARQALVRAGQLFREVVKVGLVTLRAGCRTCVITLKMGQMYWSNSCCSYSTPAQQLPNKVQHIKCGFT